MTAVVSTPVVGQWLRQLLSGRPHQVVESDKGTYLHRWYLLPHNARHNLFLHKFVRSDDPGPLHDHPWPFVSVVVAGAYREVTSGKVILRRRGSLARRQAAHRHRVELLRDPRGVEIPCYTVVLTGRRQRPWGFWCAHPHGAERFVPWQQFGPRGCGDQGGPDVRQT
jgi:hypothetical protein